ncbi:MAG: right-handed parallel beta-helix repeat-containing protein, partial [Oscillospiraceae bacterium]|nr:right-handed parallel beta-helix repeat-containing protein [Oscillospiraceae bacterium]
IVLWEPKEVDTYLGLGKLQLQLQIGNILGKSVVFQTVCERSIDERKDDVSIPEAAYKKQTSSYVLELLKYGISSDGSNAESTTKGINQAIADAVANGYSTIVFPKGEYLIAAESQIEITGQLTVDFNNSVLRKEANANASYVMVNISGDHNVVKNATLYGDRETHDYSSGGTHEWGIGIDITADSRFTVIENVDIFDTTGYGINTSVMHNQIEPIRDRPLEAGCYDTSTGELVESTTHTVLGYTLDITDSAIKNDMFILGGNGYCAHGIAEPLTFYMSFYDENETYIGFSRAYRLYDNVDLESLLYWYPTLRYIKFSIENTDTETSVTLELRSSYTSDDITIKNCEIARCRTLGIAITGGKRILVENVSIHDIGGAAPGYGVDIEDGYQLNQYIVFRSCEFYNNKFGDIIVAKARDVLVENCRFQGFQRPEGGTAVPQGISAYGTITSKFVVRDCVFTETSVGGESFYLYNCMLMRCTGCEGDFTECKFYGGSIFCIHGATLNRCYLNGVTTRSRNGNYACYDSVLENECAFWDDTYSSGNTPEQWIMEGCLVKDTTVIPKTGATYIRIANNKFYRDAEDKKCLLLNTLQKTYLHIVGNTFEQAGRTGLVYLGDTYGSEVVLDGNVFKSTMTSEASPTTYQPRAHIICTGQVTVSDNIFDTAYLSAAYGVIHLENCAKTIVTNNKFLGGYKLPIKMVTVTETLCDGNDYAGTPVLADARTGVDIPDACSKSYVDGLIGDVNAVIASINDLVGGA